jgi:hypothetical protein
MGYFKLNKPSAEGSESKLSCTRKEAKMSNQDLLKIFEELARGAHQHMTSPTTKNSVTMTSKGRHCDWGIV